MAGVSTDAGRDRPVLPRLSRYSPGHTRGHIAYAGDGRVFCGDTLFACGCGRLFEGTPQQGWQSRFTPQEVYRIAVREIDQHCRAAFGRPFAQLAKDAQLALLKQLESDDVALPSFKATTSLPLAILAMSSRPSTSDSR